MAPPKRKGGGRVTPKGTQPGASTVRKVIRTSGGNDVAGGTDKHQSDDSARVAEASSRYTPPIPRSYRESPRWLPWLMGLLVVGGAITIMVTYIALDGSGWFLLLGLGAILGGIMLATQWR